MTVLTAIRPATIEDASRLLAWRNDPDAIRWSRTGAVEALGHLDWLMRVLTSSDHQIAIGEERGVPVGMVRMEQRDGLGTLSVAVDAGWRRSGVAWQLLDWQLASASAPVKAWKAVIHQDHLISRRLFVGFGFRRTLQEGHWLIYTKEASCG